MTVENGIITNNIGLMGGVSGNLSHRNRPSAVARWNKPQKKTLYCWMINKEYRVIKFEIPNYTYTGNEYIYAMDYTGKDNPTVHSVRESNIEKFTNRKFYSFTNDDFNALNAIKARINKECHDQELKYLKYKKFCDLVTNNINTEGVI